MEIAAVCADIAHGEMLLLYVGGVDIPAPPGIADAPPVPAFLIEGDAAPRLQLPPHRRCRGGCAAHIERAVHAHGAAVKRRRAERQHRRCAERGKHSLPVLIHDFVLRSCCKPHGDDKTMQYRLAPAYFTILRGRMKPSKSGKNIDSTRQKRYNKGNAMRINR